jgi:hypothetical protein
VAPAVWTVRWYGGGVSGLVLDLFPNCQTGIFLQRCKQWCNQDL